MNNNINTIYSTVSNNRTHIAADQNYIGNVNSYNNCLTQLSAAVFMKSMTVNFNGKERSVNKKSYLKLLHNLGHQDLKLSDLSQHKLFKAVAEKSQLPKGTMMRDAISGRKSDNLACKLARAIYSGQTERAKRMIGQGATLDVVYYSSNNNGVSFHSDCSNLSRTRAYKHVVFNGTAIMHAAIQRNKAVIEHLSLFGANLDTIAKSYTFERKITDVHNEFKLNSYVYYSPNRHGYLRPHVGLAPTVETVVTTQDSRYNHKEYVLDQDLNLAQRTT